MKKMAGLLIVVLSLVLGIGMSVKAAALKDDCSDFSVKQYDKMEEAYVKEAKMILLEKGCKNAGITLTYITGVDGNREYTITIHHSKLDKMEVRELALLTSRLQESAGKILLTEVSLKQL